MKHWGTIAAALALASVCSCLEAGDWTTFAHDPARTGWANEEKALSPQTVPGLRLQWKAHVDNKSYSLSALTAPIVVAMQAADGRSRSVVYVAGSAGSVFALDGATGEIRWTKTLHSLVLPGKGGFQGTFLCPNGITATPVADTVTSSSLYVIAPDGALYGLDLLTGRVQYGPVAFVAPFAKSWSLNLVHGTVYTTVSLGCGNGRAGIYGADIGNPQKTQLRQLLLSKAYTAGIWGRGGPVIGGGLIYGGTADGDTDPANGDYSNAVVSASTDDLSLQDYFLPRNFEYLKKADMDVGSASPVWFEWNGQHVLADGFKEGVVYLLDADHLGLQDHQTPLFASARLGNDRAECCASSGIWGGLSSSLDAAGQRWLYVPMGGPPSVQAPKFPISNGDNPHGSIMAFRVMADQKSHHPVLTPAWVSGDFYYPDPAVIANGVVFALSNGENPDQHGDESRRFLNTRAAQLKALDAQTGRELYNSGPAMTSWVHFSGLAVSDGHVYAVDHDSNVYCFGIGKGSASPQLSSAPLDHPQDQLSTSWVGRAERQDEFLRSWMMRIAGVTALVALIALAGIWAALRDHSRVSRAEG